MKIETIDKLQQILEENDTKNTLFCKEALSLRKIHPKSSWENDNLH